MAVWAWPRSQREDPVRSGERAFRPADRDLQLRGVDREGAHGACRRCRGLGIGRRSRGLGRSSSITEGDALRVALAAWHARLGALSQLRLLAREGLVEPLVVLRV